MAKHPCPFLISLNPNIVMLRPSMEDLFAAFIDLDDYDSNSSSLFIDLPSRDSSISFAENMDGMKAPFWEL
ncbi:hypothetical protein ACOSP7_028521 [Xanthoceras sorbifolium]